MLRQLHTLLLILLVSVATATAAGGGGGSSNYVSLSPAFVVNVSDGERVHHMQLTVQLKLSGSDLAGYIEQHNAALRHEMVMLLSGQPVAELKTAQGKIKLSQQALTALQNVMTENIGVPAIEAVYFTDMIIQ